MTKRRALDDEVTVVLFCYSKEEWDLWRANVEDREMFEETWDEWWAVLQKKRREIAREGISARLVWVAYEEFAEHCRKTGAENDASARTRYAAEIARKESSGKGEGRS